MAPRIPYSDYKFPPKVKGNIFRMLGHTPATVSSWLSIGTGHITSLDLCAYHRELVILTTSSANNAVYEWTHHQGFGLKQGITKEMMSEIAKVAALGSKEEWGCNGVEWKPKDLALVKFVVAIQRGNSVEDAIFNEARKHFSDRELMEITTVSGFYTTLAKVITTFGVELEEGVPAAKL